MASFRDCALTGSNVGDFGEALQAHRHKGNAVLILHKLPALFDLVAKLVDGHSFEGNIGHAREPIAKSQAYQRELAATRCYNRLMSEVMSTRLTEAVKAAG